MEAKLGILTIAVLTAVSSVFAQPMTLLDGKLTFETTDAFVLKTEATSSKQSIADFEGRDDSDAWGAVTRGTRGLQPDGLDTYMKNKVAEYTKGLSWVSKLNWLKKELVTINGRKWANIRFIVPRKNTKDARDGVLYTRILATSYESQLLEIMFTSNTDESPALKDNIDKVMESVRLET